MVNALHRLFGLTVLACLLLPAISIAQEIEASVDRTEVARGETLVLTIRVFQQRQGVQLDLTPLTAEFDVLSTRTSSQIRSVNGAVESWTDYIVTLLPLEEGVLTIPALSINNQQTAAIDIDVINAGPRSNQDSSDLFLQIEVNKESVYVQEQLLFTIQLFYTINGIRNPQFTELEMPDSVIQLIGSPNQYEKLIDGVRYGVYEKRYVIFPQRSGPLEIPDILFRGEVTDGSSNFVFRNLNTRRVTAFIDGITIDVKERPAAVAGFNIWLPAANVSIEESWSSDISNARIGDAIVRTLEIVAAGLDGAVLPPFSPEEIDGANIYPDPPDIQRTFVDGSIVGTRIETTSIVATDSGFVEIPEISIPWWNIDTDQLEYAVVPASRLTVATAQGDIPAEQTVASVGEIDLVLDTAPVLDQEMIDAQSQSELIEVDARWLNYLIVFSIIVVLFSVYKLVIAEHHNAIIASVRDWLTSIVDKYSPQQNERVAYSQLRRACRGNDSMAIRQALVLWTSHFYAPESILSMDDLLKRKDNEELRGLCAELQSSLYKGADAQSFDSSDLVRLTNTMRKRKQKVSKKAAQETEYKLPPLYPT